MQRDYWYTAARVPSELLPASDVGRIAGERTVRRLNARKLGTLECPVLFEAPEAADLIGCVRARGVRAAACIASRRSCSIRSGRPVFSPHRVDPRGAARSARARQRAVRCEGVATRPRDVVRDGVVEGYFLGSYSARKLGMTTTGNAGGATISSSRPATTTCRAASSAWDADCSSPSSSARASTSSPATISRGAAGFWIENGEIAYPVEEITIAGNLQGHVPGHRRRRQRRRPARLASCGSILVERMTVAGS